jgi:Flp pilus assembly protein TadD
VNRLLDSSPDDLEHMRDRIRRRFNQGDLAQAYDLCQATLRTAPNDLWLRHRTVLCLIRSGALERAERVYRDYDLSSAKHDEDLKVEKKKSLRKKGKERIN